MPISEETIEHILYLMEIYVHNLVYLSQLYPEDLFERCHKFGVYLRKCIHPDLIQYIHNVLMNTKPFLQSGEFDKLEIVFHQNEHIEFISTIQLNLNQDITNIRIIDEYFSLIYVKLNLSSQYIPLFSLDSSFYINVCLHHISNESVEIDKNAWCIDTFDDNAIQRSREIIPIKSFQNDSFNLQFFFTKYEEFLFT